MPSYLYKARDETGKLVKGALSAASQEELTDKLAKMGYMTTYVKLVKGIGIERTLEKFKGINTEDMIVFNVQLSNMINAGIPILASLKTLSGQIENKRLKEAVGSALRSVEAGDNFSGALAKQPAIFPKLFINMVKAGEASGKLDNVLSKYAQFVEHQADLRQKVKGALFYPAILLLAGAAVTLLIVTFIIPQFAQIFLKAGIKLPLITRILYAFGTAFKHFWYVVILFVIFIWLGVRHYARTPRGRFKIDRLKLKLPIIGPLYRKSAISRFSRTLGTLVGSGVPILQSLDITKEVMENEVLAGVIGSVRTAVEGGQAIAGPLGISEEFPPDCVQMISVGEETGNLDGMLNKISDFYDRSLGYTIKKLTTVLEPLLLAIMGVLVGAIMASLLLPIFDMMKVLGH